MKDPEKLFEHLVNCVENYLLDNGLSSMVLGISGGIDSTLVALICNSVVKKNPRLKLFGVSMPTRTNQNDEIDSADLVGQSLCTVYEVRPIQAIFDNFINKMTVPEEQSKLANGNIKARLRMIYLYNVAGLNNGIVMSTGNLTETLTGFWTLHGDEGDLGPIETLYKHEVYELCEWLVQKIQSEQEIYKKQENYGEVQRLTLIEEAIKASMKLTPTDGNGVMSGGDLAQIAPGYTYTDVDDVLKTIVSLGKTDLKLDQYMSILREEDIIQKYGENMVRGVTSRFIRSNYKRKHRPLIITEDGLCENNLTHS